MRFYFAQYLQRTINIRAINCPADLSLGRKAEESKKAGVFSMRITIKRVTFNARENFVVVKKGTLRRQKYFFAKSFKNKRKIKSFCFQRTWQKIYIFFLMFVLETTI